MHVFGAGLQTAAMRELHGATSREGDAFLHNDPYLGNTHTADHTILVPVFWEGEHVFTACAKAHQADCGNAARAPTCPTRATSTRRAALNFPCVRIQRDYARHRGHRPHVPAPDPRPGHVVRRLPRVGRRRADRRAADPASSSSATALEHDPRVQSSAGSTTPSGGWATRSGSCPATRLRAASAHDPMPGLPDGAPVNVALEIDPAAGRIEVDLRDNIDCVDLGINLSALHGDGWGGDRDLQLPRPRPARTTPAASAGSRS